MKVGYAGRDGSGTGAGGRPCAYIGSLVAAHPEDGLLKRWVHRQRISGSSHVLRDYAIMANG